MDYNTNHSDTYKTKIRSTVALGTLALAMGATALGLHQHNSQQTTRTSPQNTNPQSQQVDSLDNKIIDQMRNTLYLPDRKDSLDEETPPLKNHSIIK